MNHQSTDAALQGAVEAARERSIAFLLGLQAADAPRGVLRISPAHDAAAWPGVLLPGTYNGVMALDLIGGLDGFTVPERAALADWIAASRRPDGMFRIAGMAEGDVFKKPDPVETWCYIDFHVTNYSLGAIQALVPERHACLDFARPWLEPQRLEAWLARRDLRDPWQEGNNIVNLGSFLLLLRERGEMERATGEKARRRCRRRGRGLCRPPYATPQSEGAAAKAEEEEEETLPRGLLLTSSS